MNLNKLFDKQRELDERILDRFPELRNEDLLDKKILALQVELGELAQNWRGFKFWSEAQEPRTHKFKLIESETDYGEKVVTPTPYNPLLEEYVDCLHFILSIGLELEGERLYATTRGRENPTTLTDVFNSLFEIAAEVRYSTKNRHLTARGIKVAVNNYEVLLGVFTQLGEMLGFTWEQIEDAYMQKNKINHARQENGY